MYDIGYVGEPFFHRFYRSEKVRLYFAPLKHDSFNYAFRVLTHVCNFDNIGIYSATLKNMGPHDSLIMHLVKICYI